jgi:hypothetical protein
VEICFRAFRCHLRSDRFTSIEDTFTGLGGNLFIIDDPIKLGDAFSEVVRKRTIDWYRETLLTRLDDKKAARIVVLMQRVHQQDLVGYLQEQDGQFEVLNLPAIAPAHVKIPTGPDTFYYRSPGQLLHPDHEPDEVLLNLRKAMGTMAFRAQYQQTPVSADGTFIKNKWLKSYSEIAFGPRDQIVMSWDIALSEAENRRLFGRSCAAQPWRDVLRSRSCQRPLSVSKISRENHRFLVAGAVASRWN